MSGGLGYAAIMVVLVSFVSFVIIKLPPGDFLTQKMEQLRSRGDRSAEARIEQYRLRYGLDRPFIEQYIGLGHQTSSRATSASRSSTSGRSQTCWASACC